MGSALIFENHKRLESVFL